MNGNGIIMYESDSLAHYGVLGMKWGVRRYQNKDGTLTDKGQKHYGKKLYKLSKKESKYRYGKRVYDKDRSEKMDYYGDKIHKELLKDNRVNSYVNNHKSEYSKASSRYDDLYDKFRTNKSKQYKDYLSRTKQKHNEYAMDDYIHNSKLRKGDAVAEKLYKAELDVEKISNKEFNQRKKLAKEVLGPYKNKRVNRNIVDWKGTPVSDDIALMINDLEWQRKRR